MHASLDQLFLDAIRTRRLIRFRYKGRERIAEPHDYGIQNETVRLLCYQVAGHSSSRLPGWRMFDVSGMLECELLDKEFAGNRETPSRSHLRWDKVFARVGPSGTTQA
jgi:WYL domain